jgi:hypothetical protein
MNESETLDEARAGVGDYVDCYQHRPTRSSTTGRRARCARRSRVRIVAFTVCERCGRLELFNLTLG